MINPNKLFQLSGGQQRRKLALCFGALERDILGIAEKGSEYNFHSMPRAEYIKALCRVFLKDPKISPEAAKKISSLSERYLFFAYLRGKLLGGSLDNFLSSSAAAVTRGSAAVADFLDSFLGGLLSGLAVVATAGNGGGHKGHDCERHKYLLHGKYIN